jgi:hypothetical protein
MKRRKCGAKTKAIVVSGLAAVGRPRSTGRVAATGSIVRSAIDGCDQSSFCAQQARLGSAPSEKIILLGQLPNLRMERLQIRSVY